MKGHIRISVLLKGQRPHIKKVSLVECIYDKGSKRIDITNDIKLENSGNIAHEPDYRDNRFVGYYNLNDSFLIPTVKKFDLYLEIVDGDNLVHKYILLNRNIEKDSNHDSTHLKKGEV